MKKKEKTETALQEGGKDAEASKKKGGKLKAVIYTTLTLIVVIGCCVGYFFFSQSSLYFTTDNARVTAKMYNIMPLSSGKLLEWNVEAGDRVDQNQVLGRQEVLPHITAPITGTIVKNDGIEGQMVSPSTPLAVVADSDHLYIGVNIEETDITKIQVGQKVDVNLDAYPDKTFSGQVAEIDQTTQTFFSGTSSFSTSGTYTKVTQLIPVKVTFNNEQQLPMTFGMNATVKIHLKDKVPAVADKNNEKQASSDTTKTAASKNDIPLHTAEVIPSVSGKITAVNVTEGQQVKAGDVLFTLDDTDYELQLAQAEANLSAPQIAYSDAKTACDRLQSLYNEGAVSKVELDSAKTKLETAAAQIQTAKAACDIARKKVSDCTVKAPIDGTIYRINLEVGSFAGTQTSAMLIQGE